VARESGLARTVRPGLEVVGKSELNAVIGSSVVQAGVKKSVLDERQFGKSVRQHVREFGAIFAAIAFGYGAYLLWKGDYSAGLVAALAAGGSVFATLGYFFPIVLHPFWKGWMAIGTGMGLVMTTVILTVAWMTLIVPVALILKLVGKRMMDTRFGAPVDTYWETREQKCHDFKLLERQF
jgi:hypothetical protein